MEFNIIATAEKLQRNEIKDNYPKVIEAQKIVVEFMKIRIWS